MIRLTRCSQAAKAGTYFRQHLQSGDAQSRPVTSASYTMRAHWTGPGVKELGLSHLEQPQARQLVRLGRGLHPTEKRRLAPSKNRKRAYYDIMVAAPKSVSVAALLDFGHITAKNVLAAHQKAAEAVCRELGKMLAGQRKGAPAVEKWVAAMFTHTHTREGDPHLHTHIIIPNVGRNTAGTWRAIQVVIAGTGRQRLGLLYGHVLAESLRAYSLGPEVVMRKSGVPELKGLLDLSKHFVKARANVLAAAAQAEEAQQKQARAAAGYRMPLPRELHSRSKLPVRPDRVRFRVRQRLADSMRKPKPKDADDPARLDREGYRWRSSMSNQENRTLGRVLDSADPTNPRRVQVLRTLPPPLSQVVRRAFERIEGGVPRTPPVWFRSVVATSAGRHRWEDLRAELRKQLAKRRKTLERMRRQQNEESVALAQAQMAAAERGATRTPAPRETAQAAEGALEQAVLASPAPAVSTVVPGGVSGGRRGR